MRLIGFSVIVLFLISCQQRSEIDVEEETRQILALHRLQREYHFNEDSVAFADQLSDNFISVNSGTITHPNHTATISRYHNYFSAVEFEQWDDVSEPIIRFSDDGSLAYTVVDKMVVITYDRDSGDTVRDETHYAWTTIYRKYGDEWKIDCVTSTERPTASSRSQ